MAMLDFFCEMGT